MRARISSASTASTQVVSLGILSWSNPTGMLESNIRCSSIFCLFEWLAVLFPGRNHTIEQATLHIRNRLAQDVPQKVPDGLIVPLKVESFQWSTGNHFVIDVSSSAEGNSCSRTTYVSGTPDDPRNCSKYLVRPPREVGNEG
jgi:hypothetical protein